jgi:hypothetical protein
MLQSHGYKILAAESGVRALEIWREHPEETPCFDGCGNPTGGRGPASSSGLNSFAQSDFTSGYSADGRQRLDLWIELPANPYRAPIAQPCVNVSNTT